LSGHGPVVPALKLDAQNNPSYKGRGRGRNRNQNLRRLATMRANSAREDAGRPQIDLGVEDDGGRGPLTRAASLQDLTKLRKRPPVKPPRVKVLSKPYFIATVSIIQVILMIWELIAGGGFLPFSENPFLGPGPETYIIFGGKWVPSIINNQEWWRFVTAIFLHSGLAHIAFNLLSQIKVGFDLERVHGTYRLFPIYIISGIYGNLVSAIFLPKSVTVGASGSIFGFFGVLLVDLIKNWKKLPSPRKSLLILVVSIVISFAFGLMPGVDNWAHGAGFVMGLLSGVVFLPSMHIGKFNMRRRILQVLISLPLMLALLGGTFYVFYRGVPADFCPWCTAVTCLPVFPACRAGVTTPTPSSAPLAG
jgi:membrane associated rhomboid family serine protease